MEKSSFFNSVNHDRRYKAEDWAEFFGSFIGNGVFANPASGLQVVADSGMTIAVQPGKAWINGYFYVNTDKLYIKLDNADGALKRIARVVLRWDLLARRMYAAVKYSSFSASPAAPALQRTADVYEICLGDVTIGAGVTAITQSVITDRRMDASLCGVVAGTVQQIDPTSLFAQYNAAFWEWFDGIRDTLDEDAEGNLYNLIQQTSQNLQSQITDANAAISSLSQRTRTIYVDGSVGSDSNDGTADAPLKTISYAMSLVPNTCILTLRLSGSFTNENKTIQGFSGRLNIVLDVSTKNFVFGTGSDGSVFYIYDCNSVNISMVNSSSTNRNARFCNPVRIYNTTFTLQGLDANNRLHFDQSGSYSGSLTLNNATGTLANFTVTCGSNAAGSGIASTGGALFISGTNTLNNLQYGLYVAGGNISVDTITITNCQYGVRASRGSMVSIATPTVSGNTTNYSKSGGCIAVGSTWQ